MKKLLLLVNVVFFNLAPFTENVIRLVLHPQRLKSSHLFSPNFKTKTINDHAFNHCSFQGEKKTGNI